jgi:hypothetical protein
MKRVLTALLIAVFFSLTFFTPRVLAAIECPANDQGQYTGPFCQVCNEGATGANGGTTTPDQSSTNPSTVCLDKEQNDDPILGRHGILFRTVRFIAYMTGIASVIIIIISGIKYMTSTGDSAAVDNAKNTLAYALIGALISVIAIYILQFAIGSVG